MIGLFIVIGVITLVAGVLVKECKLYGLLNVYQGLSADKSSSIARLFGSSMYTITGFSICLAVLNWFSSISVPINMTIFFVVFGSVMINLFIKCDKVAEVPKKVSILKVIALLILFVFAIFYYWTR